MSGCNSKKNNNTNNENEKKETMDFTCPQCEEKGSKVKMITLQSLLKECCKSKIENDIPYKFCKNSNCNVVYFSNQKEFFFTKDDLSVKATQKDSGLDVNVCYCFGYTRQDILDELKSTGKTDALNDIKAKMKAPGCFCETSNPQGGCCLGNVTAWIKEAKEIILKKKPF